MTSTKVIGIASKASNISSYVMALDEWAAIPSNPRQRDTERNMQRHIKRGNWGLGKLRDEHLIVAAGRLPSGVMYKLDGHSRTEAWMQGKMERPEYVFVTIINKPDIAAICDSYTLFDNQDAVETTDDKIFGAGREASVEFQSAFMRNRKFGTALMYSEGFTQRKGYDEYGSFKKYMEALQYIDSLNINQRLFTTGITTAAILSLSAPRSNARVRNSVRQLWHDFAKGGVVVLEGKVDAVGALHLVKQGVSKGIYGGFGGGRDSSFALAELCLGIIEDYAKDPSVKYEVGVVSVREDGCKVNVLTVHGFKGISIGEYRRSYF